MAVEDFKVYTQDSGWVSLAQTLPQGTSEGQLLHWDGTQWAAASDGTADGQYLIWDDTAKRWEPGTHETGNLPISSDDGTVVLDSPSADTFSVSTGGTEAIRVNGANHVAINPLDSYSGGSSVPRSNTMLEVVSDATSPFGLILDATSAQGVFDGRSGIRQYGTSTTIYEYCVDTTNGTYMFSGGPNSRSSIIYGDTFADILVKPGEYVRLTPVVKTPTVKGLADTDAQIDLGAELLTTNHTPTQPNSIATKQYVDDKIWVGTTASYNAIATKNPTTLYCLTD